MTIPNLWNGMPVSVEPCRSIAKGGYLAPPDLFSAKHILTFAALTYLASSLFSLVNMWLWIRLVRR